MAGGVQLAEKPPSGASHVVTPLRHWPEGSRYSRSTVLRPLVISADGAGRNRPRSVTGAPRRTLVAAAATVSRGFTRTTILVSGRRGSASCAATANVSAPLAAGRTE